MFSKRRRAASNPPQRAPPSASASLAATKAFVQQRESNTDLSSAAAAAALRTHVTTPTPVGDTVTKRMVRRGSASSNGSSARPQMGGLRRQSSSGSMTERSFRAASPARGLPAEQHPPPVPPVPQSHLQQASAVHRRASSLEPTYRGGSPGPRSGGRGVSLDRGASSTAARGHQRQASHLAQVSEEEDAVRNLVNFSRPMSPGASATRKPSPPTSHGWFGGPVVNQSAVQRMASTSRPQTSSGVSAYDLQSAQRSVQRAAERPVKTHQVSHGVEGTRLNNGSMRGKPSGTAVQSRSFLPATRQPSGPVDPNSPDAVYDPSTRTFIRKADAMAIHRELHEEPEQPTRQYVAQHVDDYHRQPISPPQSGRGSPSPRQQYVPRVESPPAQRREEPSRPSTAIRTPQPAARPRTPEPRVESARQTRSSEDFADAEVQPSQQANIGRALDQTSFTEPEQPNVGATNFKANQDSSYPHLTAPAKAAPTNTTAGPKRASTPSGQDRPVSLSPHRNAHFALGVVELAGTKHEPLPRSISPAKSALKSSPSVSRRSHSPVASNGRLTSKSASSEASDATSDAGSQKRKKSVRVSFEQTPIIAGPAAGADVKPPPTHSGLGASQWSPIAEKDNEFEDFMKPRAPLPVFGSIREKERRPASEDMAEKVTETVTTTPLSASIGSIAENPNASNDHALGNLVAHDFAEKNKASQSPVPPQVTSVEGSGYVSDSSDESAAQKHGGSADQSTTLPEPKSLTSQYDKESSSPAPISKQVIEVPQFALQPATPSPYERPEPQFQAMTIPGGWDEDGNEIAPKAGAQGDGKNKEQASTPTDQTVPPKAQQISFAEDGETTEDDSSVYSDAYEDLTDTEGGFASIDALMRSPTGPSSPGLMSSKYANETTDGLMAKRNDDLDSDADSDVTTTQDWGAAQKHWSNVSAAQKQSQRDAPVANEDSRAEADVDHVVQAPVIAKEPTAITTSDKRTVQPSTQRSTQQAAQVTPKPLKSALKKTTPQTTPAPEPKMRQSMRGPPSRESAPETHMKKTMRAGAGGMNTTSRAEPTMRTSMRYSSDSGLRAQPQMRQSMRGADASPSAPMGLAASRHSITPGDAKPPRGALQKKHIQAALAASKARPQSMPAAKAAPVPTYDSDSDASASSFQRTRARGRNQPGRMTMRGSMRQETTPTMRGAAPAPKQVRAISPPGSPAPAIRKSMRPSSPTPEAVKSSRFSIRSLSPMGRFRKGPEVRPSSPTLSKPMPAMPAFNKQPKPQKPSQKPPQKQKAPVAERAKAFTSRFADSSDEDDDAQPRRFQSRFADSDDDEPMDYKLPPGLAPVRGIPRTRDDDEDSTDLEEEAEEIPKVATAPATKTRPATGGPANGQTNGSSQGQGTALATGSLRDSKYAPSATASDAGTPTKQKRGFFGLGKKKKSFVGSHGTTESIAAPDEIPMPPSQRNRDQDLPLTPINEDQDFDTLVAPSPQSKKSPKLQRRSTPEWPLPSPPTIGAEERPVSSDGVAPRRPRFTNRQSSQISNVTAPVMDAQGRSVSYGRTGKKKKFQGLRRVFGLHD